MNTTPHPIAKWRGAGSGRYRLHDGSIGSYVDACRECLQYWQQKKAECEERIMHFENEIVRELDKQ
jgi:hypothetical protein